LSVFFADWIRSGGNRLWRLLSPSIPRLAAQGSPGMTILGGEPFRESPMDDLLFRVKVRGAGLLWRLVSPVRRLYWRAVRPRTQGVKCIVVHGNEVLLVRLNYAHRRWTLPGGGVGRRESLQEAAIREVREETGVRITDAVKVGEYVTTAEFKFDTVHVFHAVAGSRPEPRADGIEIAEAGWFALDRLPANRTARLEGLIALARGT
jgi:ADP-ribose pyrophosphatase YjhB (NUDIX family)